MGYFDTTKTKSDSDLLRLRDAASSLFTGNSKLIIGTNGSLARREMTVGSDVDLFYLDVDNDPVVTEAVTQFNGFVGKNFKLPDVRGVFKDPLSSAALYEKIGGEDDTNTTITRRMLLLLEGDWLFNPSGFRRVREGIVSAYTSNELRNDQICLFLLNDIIRYWRTICVDLEHKVRVDGKPRAIRLIKLRFSRMLIYVGGVVAVADTHNRSAKDKRSSLLDHFELSPLDRIEKIVGPAAAEIKSRYEAFLEQLDDQKIRNQLEIPGQAGEETAEFKKLDLEAREFKQAISRMIDEKFGTDHPLRLALMY